MGREVHFRTNRSMSIIYMGYFITLSGLDGSGKTTQCLKLKKKMINTGITVNVIHFKKVDSFPYLFIAKKKRLNNLLFQKILKILSNKEVF